MKLYDFAEKAFEMEAAGKKIVRLYIGEPETGTPKEIVEAGVRALRGGRTRYSDFQGEPALREKIAKRHRVEAENVVITPGSKFAVFAAIKALAKAGDNACILSPHWPGYESICGELGVEARLVKSTLEEKWVPAPEKLAGAMDWRTKLVIACNPNNPTSTVIEKTRLAQLVETAHAKGARFLLDEAYRGLAFAQMGEQLNAGDERNLLAASFSKGFAMTGWRAGYLIAGKDVARKAVSLAKATYSCVPQFVQEAALKAMEMPEVEAAAARVYEGRAKLACKILREKFELAEPQAGFYVFAGRRGLDGDGLCLKLLEQGIGIAPGSAFGYPEFVRISLVQQERELDKNLQAIVDAVDGGERNGR